MKHNTVLSSNTLSATNRWWIIVSALSLAMTVLSLQTARAQSLEGKASYYSNALHGRKMSNGEPYDKNRMTCAHRTLPFGTRLRVTNRTNGKQVIVEVTDRGPFVRGRIIDLSYAAARELGTLTAGIGSVQIEVLPQDVEVPFMTEENSLNIQTIEYGTAGVCYEFIPEWKEEKLEGHVQGNRNSTVSSANSTSKTSIRTNDQQNQFPKKTGKKRNTNTHETKKEGSRSWTDFFDKLRNW